MSPLAHIDTFNYQGRGRGEVRRFSMDDALVGVGAHNCLIVASL